MLLVTAEEMASMDRATIDNVGIPGVVLMERAGIGATEFYKEIVPDILQRRVLIVTGSGNNGGDGFVIARQLWDKGCRKVKVVSLKDTNKLRGDALTNCNIIKNMGIPLEEYTGENDLDAIISQLDKCDVIVDAILGTGLKSDVRGYYGKVIEQINLQKKIVLAVDIPSGLDASTGRPLGICVKATATATFGLPKVGQLISPGHAWVGELRIVDIGIPESVVKEFKPKRIFFSKEDAATHIKSRAMDSHKGTYGHLFIFSGSEGKTGAATLSSIGASRVGTGLVTLAIPGSLNPIMEMKLTEPMTVPLPETPAKSASYESLEIIIKHMVGKQAFAMGPGISLEEETQALARDLALEIKCPKVIDADGITAFRGHLDLLGKIPGPVVFTPHPGEMARLLETEASSVQGKRLEVAEGFSQEHKVVVVLKGYRTVISSPDGRTAINSSGNPFMASGGMGDVLTGMIGGFLAQGYEPFVAACLGVYIHGLAGDHVLTDQRGPGILAGDLLPILPVILKKLGESKQNASDL